VSSGGAVPVRGPADGDFPFCDSFKSHPAFIIAAAGSSRSTPPPTTSVRLAQATPGRSARRPARAAGPRGRRGWGGRIVPCGRRTRVVRDHFADGHGGVGEFTESQRAGGELAFRLHPEFWGNLLPEPVRANRAVAARSPAAAESRKRATSFLASWGLELLSPPDGEDAEREGLAGRRRGFRVGGGRAPRELSPIRHRGRRAEQSRRRKAKRSFIGTLIHS
jgi:hypothetical protein